MNINKAVLYGNLTRAPESRALPSGESVVNFSVATNRAYKNKAGEKQEATEFHNCVAFGRTGEVIAQYVKKGDPIYVEGRLQTRSWEVEGVKHYRTEVVVESFQFGPKAKSEPEEEDQSPKEEVAIKYPDEEIDPESIPF